MSEPVVLPALPDLCWPVDWSCVPAAELDGMDEGLRARAEVMAAQVLRSLTAYRVGGCPIVVRPCASGCGPTGSYMAAPTVGANADALGGPVAQWWPHVESGAWVNTSCGCTSSGCGCSVVPEVQLPGPVGYVAEVRVDGQVLAASAYRVDDGYRLVRTDGGSWPKCQDMAAGIDQEGAFSVEYLQGYPVDGLGSWVAGVLANEFALACNGSKCRLPAGVTTIARQGVSMDLVTGAFSTGLTGITEVDAWVRAWNPNHLVMPTTVWAPGLASAKARTTTWQRAVGG